MYKSILKVCIGKFSELKHIIDFLCRCNTQQCVEWVNISKIANPPTFVDFESLFFFYFLHTLWTDLLSLAPVGVVLLLLLNQMCLIMSGSWNMKALTYDKNNFLLVNDWNVLPYMVKLNSRYVIMSTKPNCRCAGQTVKDLRQEVSVCRLLRIDGYP